MDVVYDTWLARQYEEGLALSADSDVLELQALPDRFPPRRYRAHFGSPTMICNAGRITQAEGFVVLIQFPDNYLRATLDTARIVALWSPPNVFHPNVAWPFICTGNIHPGTSLRDIVYQVYEILTFQRV